MAGPKNFHDSWKHEMAPNVSNSWPQIKKKISWLLVVDVWWHIT